MSQTQVTKKRSKDILQYFGQNKRSTKEKSSRAEVSVTTKKVSIFESALKAKVDTIASSETNDIVSEKNPQCDGNSCVLAKKLQEITAEKILLQNKYNAMRIKYLKAMDLNLELQKKLMKLETPVKEINRTLDGCPKTTLQLSVRKIMCIINRRLYLDFSFKLG